jgi:hypothetical protein
VEGALQAADVGSVRPNPSTGGASIPLTLSQEAMVEAVLYDVLGRRVALLASGRYAAGRHVLTLDGSALPVGVYVVRVVAGDTVAAHALTLLR